MAHECIIQTCPALIRIHSTVLNAPIHSALIHANMRQREAFTALCSPYMSAAPAQNAAPPCYDMYVSLRCSVLCVQSKLLYKIHPTMCLFYVFVAFPAQSPETAGDGGEFPHPCRLPVFPAPPLSHLWTHAGCMVGLHKPLTVCVGSPSAFIAMCHYGGVPQPCFREQGFHLRGSWRLHVIPTTFPSKIAFH